MKNFNYLILVLISINLMSFWYAQSAPQTVLDVSSYRTGTLIPHKNRLIPFTETWTAQENGQTVYYGYQPPQFYVRAKKS